MAQMNDEELRKVKNPAGTPLVKTDDLLRGVLAYVNEASISERRKAAGKRPYVIPVIAAQNRAGRDLQGVTTIYPGTLPKGADGVHYSSGGYITLGKFTASAVEEYVSEREN